MSEVLTIIDNSGLIAEVSVSKKSQVSGLISAGVAASLPCIEVAYDSNSADIIAGLKSAYQQCVLGVGHISSLSEVEPLSTFVDFISCDSFHDDFIKEVQKFFPNLIIIPTVNNASEAEAAKALGLEVVRVTALDKLAEITAGAPELKIIVSGLSADVDFTTYLDLPYVAAVEDDYSFRELIEVGDKKAFANKFGALFNQIMAFDVGHVGINAGTIENAEKVTDRIIQLFGTDKRETPLAFFSGDLVEVMKRPFVGQCGHICIDTRDLKRAMAMLENKGIEFVPELFMYNAQGKLMTVYLKEEIGGFAFHVRERPLSRRRK